MQALKFTLSGKTAFFKRPEVNTYYYYTFGNIHKVALLGMFGAILGYHGYNNTIELPEFYQKLKDIKVSILPQNKKGYFSKKIQYYNNSVGYASKEQGGNLIIKEQWLEDPCWNIIVLLDNEEANMEIGYDQFEVYLVNRGGVKPLGCSDFVCGEVSRQIQNLYKVIVDADSNLGINDEVKSIIDLYMNEDEELPFN